MFFFDLPPIILTPLIRRLNCHIETHSSNQAAHNTPNPTGIIIIIIILIIGGSIVRLPMGEVFVGRE